MREDGYSLQDLGGLVRRRSRLIIYTFLAFPIIALIAAFSIDSLYSSSGTIIIEEPEVSESFLPGQYSDTDREQRISRIYDEVMTRENLATIVDKHGLYEELRVDDRPESVVGELRDNFEMELILGQSDPRNKRLGEVVGFELTYFHPSATTARSVARDIVGLFLEGNRSRRQAAYDETAAALEREADDLRTQVSLLEAKLAEFKTVNPGALPEDRNYNRSIVERKAGDLDVLDREIRSLQERKTLLQSQLALTEPWLSSIGPDGQPLPTTSERLKQLQAEYLRLLGNYNANHPDVLRLRREIESLTGGTSSPAFRQAVASELQLKQTELMDARTLYGEDHPDIRNLERAIEALQSQIAGMPETSLDTIPPNNPAYINADLQLKAVDTELAALQFDRQLLQAEVRDLETKVQIAPEVEREFLDLTRDLGLARKHYEDIRSRQMTVQRAGIMENEELTDRYVLTRVPSLAFSPSYPNRPLFFVIGLFFGLTIAVGAAITAEALDGSVRSTRDIETILGMPPIAAIPTIATTLDARATRRNNILANTLLISTLVAVGVYIQLQRTGAI